MLSVACATRPSSNYLCRFSPCWIQTLFIQPARMPHILISTQIRLECGPTFCGDQHAPPEVMQMLDAVLKQPFGNKFKEYESPHSPRVVLDKLEDHGYKIIAATGVGQTIIWTLHKPGLHASVSEGTR